MTALPITDDWGTMTASWQLSMESDGDAAHTRRAYRQGLASLATWLAIEHPDVGPTDLTRDHVRAWVAHVRATRSQATAKLHFAGVRRFCRWLLAEDEATTDPTDRVRYPVAPVPETPVLSKDAMRDLLAACDGKGFLARRDRAIVAILLETGVRRAELLNLTTDDVSLGDRALFVAGKGSQRSGPRRRQVTLGAGATQALDRYLRERRHHPHANDVSLWLGNRGPLSASGLVDALQRRAKQAGIEHLHPHMLRHTFAHQFRADGGNEGDLMVLGGWRNRSILDRYGSTMAGERAAEAAKQHSLLDRL